MRSSLDLWYLLISLRATIPGLYLWGFLTSLGVRNRFTGSLGGQLFSGGLAFGGFASGLFGTSFGGSSEQARKCCWRAESQHCYRSSWWRLWQCNLTVALIRVCNSSSSYWSNSMSSISNVLRISLGFSLTPSDVANSSRSITDLGNNISTYLFILNLFSFTVFLVQTFSVVGTHFCVTRTSSSVYFSILRHWVFICSRLSINWATVRVPGTAARGAAMATAARTEIQLQHQALGLLS